MYARISVAVVTIGFLYIIHPMILSLVMGGILAVLFMPLLKKLEKRKLSTGFASLLITLGITLVVLIPTVVLVYQAAKTGVKQVQVWKENPGVSGDWVGGLMETPMIRGALERITQWFPIEMAELTDSLHDLIRSVGAKAADVLGSFLTSLPGIAMALTIAVVSTYFFLVDGRRLAAFVRTHSFYPPRQTEMLLRSLSVACRSVVLASVVSGIAQAFFFSLVMLISGVSNFAVTGVILFFASFVPVLGTSPVTFGVGLYQLLAGHTVVGIVLLVAAVIVSMMDNVIRPWFLKGAVNLHPLLAFVAAFGGLQTIGFAGVFLGPIIAALLLTLILILTEGPESIAPPEAAESD